MEHASVHDPALTVGIALAAGVLAQSLARHLRLPGIVVLLVTGVLLGPAALGWVQPAALGGGLQSIVSFAVAVILFEGGLNLKLSRLRRQGRMVRRLLTVGAAITMAGGTLAARWILGWDWRLALLFGSLVIVTGPTVVTPLLRRVRISRRAQTVLEAEGVLIDAVGAITAIVTLEVLLHPTLEATAEGLRGFALSFGTGVPMGLAAGMLIAGGLRLQRAVPDGLENIFALAIALAVTQIGDAVAPEAGIVAVTVAGIVVGNVRTRVTRELTEFKEQLTVLLIGLLFVLLAAAVRPQEVVALGWRGVGVVAALMLVVRPVQVALCGIGTSLDARERAFVGWIAPRGIVAAAVASLFATAMQREGIPGGESLAALVFLVIAMTVTIQGLTIGFVATALGVRRDAEGYVILGASGLALALAEALRDAGEECVFIESDPDRANRAQDDGFTVVFGNGLEESVVLRAQPEIRRGAIALTTNEEANLLFARHLSEEHRCANTWVALDRVAGHLTTEVVHATRAAVLFGGRRDLGSWALRLERDRALVECRVASRPDCLPPGSGVADARDAGPAREPVLPLVHVRDSIAAPYDDGVVPAEGDRVYFAVDAVDRERADRRLADAGWLLPGDRSPGHHAAQS